MRRRLSGLFLTFILLASCALESKDAPVEVYRTKNFLFNSNFTHWQRGKSFDVKNSQGVYGADRWYLKNTMGDNSNVSYTRVSPTLVGSNYGAKVEIISAPTANQKDGCELIQTLDNATTLNTFHEPVSFSVQVKALGQTSQVGLQLLFNDSEIMATRPVSEEVIYAINPDSFTRLDLNNQSLALVPRTGVVGVRVRVLGHNKGDGFIVEQAILNPGVYASPYAPRFESLDADELSCQRFYEKSFARDEDPLPKEEAVRGVILIGSTPMQTLNFKPKRVAPKKIVLFDPENIKTDRPVVESKTITDRSCIIRVKKPRPLNWTIDAEIQEEPPGP